jgi:transcriptional regulator with XRE-family HTH domain
VKLRQARRVSVTALASALGIAYQRIYGIETGRSCSIYLLVRIAGVLGVEVCALLPVLSSSCKWKKSAPRVGKSC